MPTSALIHLLTVQIDFGQADKRALWRFKGGNIDNLDNGVPVSVYSASCPDSVVDPKGASLQDES
ncbi:uncharacterized protein FPRO_05551 [Fusarium proliferatum ET1]|uniref:Uncharacterized protein n=1 Tax=Fusarium proliferatum (strain ET1) TaxID=1227346 RepID=A0A1L7VF15_FUSPR|nr:uncharacterized protein FPRO_05551 [Fusarium proliferatum ET1]CZR39257.1 uncharacterized protein FPRO_05551 [Fusarium proliferatum ET1]